MSFLQTVAKCGALNFVQYFFWINLYMLYRYRLLISLHVLEVWNLDTRTLRSLDVAFNRFLDEII